MSDNDFPLRQLYGRLAEDPPVVSDWLEPVRRRVRTRQRTRQLAYFGAAVAVLVPVGLGVALAGQGDVGRVGLITTAPPATVQPSATTSPTVMPSPTSDAATPSPTPVKTNMTNPPATAQEPLPEPTPAATFQPLRPAPPERVMTADLSGPVDVTVGDTVNYVAKATSTTGQPYISVCGYYEGGTLCLEGGGMPSCKELKSEGPGTARTEYPVTFDRVGTYQLWMAAQDSPGGCTYARDYLTVTIRPAPSGSPTP